MLEGQSCAQFHLITNQLPYYINTDFNNNNIAQHCNDENRWSLVFVSIFLLFFLFSLLLLLSESHMPNARYNSMGYNDTRISSSNKHPTLSSLLQHLFNVYIYRSSYNSHVLCIRSIINTAYEHKKTKEKG